MKQVARTSKQIGAALRRRRKRLGLSQESLGDRAKIRQATVSKLESGDPGCKLGTLLDALAALNLEIVIRDRSTTLPHAEDLF